MISRVGFFFVLFFALFLSTTLKAQKKKERQIARLETAANQMYESELYGEALDTYLLLDSLSPDNPEYQFRIGIIYYHSIDKAKSLDYFLDAIQNGKTDPNLDFYLARAYHFNLKFDSAVHYYDIALKAPDSFNRFDQKERLEIEKYIQDCTLAEQYIKEPVITPIDNFGAPINSPYPEYVPLMNATEDMIIFTSRRPNTTGKSIDPSGLFMEDVYISNLNRDGTWSEPDNDLKFNTPDHDACVGLSPDGSKLILYKSDNGGDLYISDMVNGKWSDPEPIPGINTSNWESSASFTPDEKFIYFTSDKPGGYGGSDIYRAELLDNGKYGNIENLGDVINTPFDEDAPQIHIDGRTLFYSSRGHVGLGGYDIYSSVYLEEIESWTEPRNIGYPINTPDDDIYFTLHANGAKGFFASYRNDSYGEKDIYMIVRPGSVSTNFIMKFNLIDPNINRAIDANLRITDVRTGESKVLKSEDFPDGKYNTTMEFEKNYKLGIEAEGYRFREKNIIIPYRADIFEYVLDIVPNKDEVISIVDSTEFVDAVQRKRSEGTSGLTAGSDFDSMTNDEDADLSTDQTISVNTRERGDRTRKPRDMTSSVIADPNQNGVKYDNKFYVDDEVRDYDYLERLIASLASSGDDRRLRSVMEREEGVIFLSRIDTKGKVIIPTINFDFDSYELKPRYKFGLDELVDFLYDVKHVKIFISGHTDYIGTNAYNDKLSNRRAGVVKYYLSKKGIEGTRLHSKGYGETIPIWNNKSVLGRFLNRRVNMFFVDAFDLRYTSVKYRQLIYENGIELSPKEGYLSNLIVWEKLPVSAHFDVNHTIPLTQYSADKIDILVEYLKKTQLKLVIVGFEDLKSENLRLNLSEKRARAVKDYLRKRGVSEERMMIMDKKHFADIYDVMNLEAGIARRRVQFFLVRD
jgi:outer membrane protein OmpA-like peptidoglycan-associated protein